MSLLRAVELRDSETPCRTRDDLAASLIRTLISLCARACSMLVVPAASGGIAVTPRAWSRLTHRGRSLPRESMDWGVNPERRR